MLGCFPAVGAGRRPPRSPPTGLLNLIYDDGSTSTSVSVSPPSSASTSSSAFLDEVDPADADAQADLSSAIASRRLSLALPGRSNSIVDSSSPEHAAAPSCHGGTTCSVIPTQEAVRSVTLSTDAPRAEFLKSILEMAEAALASRKAAPAAGGRLARAGCPQGPLGLHRAPGLPQPTSPRCPAFTLCALLQPRVTLARWMVGLATSHRHCLGIPVDNSYWRRVVDDSCWRRAITLDYCCPHAAPVSCR
ncbi:uncharacterized protein [Triticum aestivum]|uniref:uncharacterized protein n=1 Tax=Triticum aestivum TaxID=4565 RepID=UPI001D011D06|nr:uncharacterized protein LOC123175519 [Triticum aestivum]